MPSIALQRRGTVVVPALKLALSLSLLLSQPALATPPSKGDPAAGKIRAAACGGCHGMQGKALSPSFPNLAGQKEKYLIKAMHAYKSGARNDPTMRAMVMSLSETDMSNIAAYFSSQPR